MSCAGRHCPAAGPVNAMRVGIYNRYWSTYGGGERYAAALAAALQDAADVELIGIDRQDPADLGPRLGLTLDRVRYVRWPALPCARLTPYTRPYDLFINATFGSSLRSEARRSAYVVFFPQRVVSRPQAMLRRLAHTALRALAPWRLRFVGGHDNPDGDGNYPTGPDVWLHLTPRAFRGGTAAIHLRPGPVPSTITAVHGPVVAWSATPDRLQVTVDRVPRAPVELHVCCAPDTTPAEGGGRLPGLCIAAGHGRHRLARLSRNATRTLSDRDFLQDYDCLLAISAYTQAWVRRRWGRDALLLPPPVDTARLRGTAGGKARVILSVGRFFAAQHNKKHLELLRVFRAMCDRGLVPAGWEYHLAGNVHRETAEHRAYFAAVQRLAAGYPVRVLASLPAGRLAAEYRAASIFWHATGWGENERMHPERFEHFGITTVEAMSAGCIPVVIAGGGQQEIVTDGVDGFTFRTAEELIRTTAALMAAHSTAANIRLGEAARHTASRFDRQHFISRARGLLPAGPA